MNDWKINKEINVGELISIALLIGGIVGMYINLDRKVEKNTLVNDQQSVQMERIVNSVEANRLENKSDMQRLESKFDELSVDIRSYIIKSEK